MKYALAQRVCAGRWLRQAAIVAAICVVFAAARSSTSRGGVSRATSEQASRFREVSDTAGLFEAIDGFGPEGGTVFLKPGDYAIERTLEIRAKHDVRISGSGWNTRVIRRGAGDAIRLTDASFCTLENLLLLGDESARTGSGIVYQGHSSSCTIDSCRICNFAESGVRFEGGHNLPCRATPSATAICWAISATSYGAGRTTTSTSLAISSARIEGHREADVCSITPRPEPIR